MAITLVGTPYTKTSNNRETSWDTVVSGATAGNMLVGCFAVYDTGDPILSSIDAGANWDKRQEYMSGNRIGITVFTREATGNSNDDLNITFTGDARPITQIFELNDSAGTPVFEASNIDTTEANDTTAQSCVTGDATASNADGIAVAILGVRQGNEWDPTTITGYSDQNRLVGNGIYRAIEMALKTHTSSGTKNGTFETVDTGGEAIGAICVFGEPAVGGGTRPQGPLGHPFIGAFGGPI